MTTFVMDAPVVINLAADGATIPPEHSLAAPTLLRSQALALVYESVHRGEIEKRTGAGRFSMIFAGCGSDSSATEHCRTTHGE